jgi:3-oxoacyl-[acyl-carrier protein] reductase
MALAAEGARVAIAARGEEALRATAMEIAGATGGTVLAVPTDVGDAGAIGDLVDEVESELGPVSILVTNAGGPRPGNFTAVAEQDWEEAFTLTLMSAVRLIRRVLPGMRERRWGRIVNITSASVKQPMPDLILSNALRSAVVAMAKTLSDEVAGEGITVNNVCPGSFDTDRIRSLNEAAAAREGVPVETVAQRALAAIPAGRIGRPEELAALIAFLASEPAAYITGATIQVDGGRYRGTW